MYTGQRCIQRHYEQSLSQGRVSLLAPPQPREVSLWLESADHSKPEMGQMGLLGPVRPHLRCDCLLCSHCCPAMPMWLSLPFLPNTGSLCCSLAALTGRWPDPQPFLPLFFLLFSVSLVLLEPLHSSTLETKLQGSSQGLPLYKVLGQTLLSNSVPC